MCFEKTPAPLGIKLILPLSVGKSKSQGAAANPSSSETYRLLLVGVTGSGKSSLGNAILGKEKFQPAIGFGSGTQICRLERETRDNIQLEVSWLVLGF